MIERGIFLPLISANRCVFCRRNTVVVNHSKDTSILVGNNRGHGLNFLVINDGCIQPKEIQPFSRRFAGKQASGSG